MRAVIKDIDRLREIIPTLYGRPFSFDVETTGLDYLKNDLLGVALTFPIPTERNIFDKRPLESYYIVLKHTVENWDGSVFVQEFITNQDFANAVRGLFAQRDVVMVAHNAKFDLHFIQRSNVLVEGKLFDTLLAAQLIDENRDNGLKDLAVLTGETDMVKFETLAKYKEYGKREILAVPLVDAAQYAMLDTEVTWKLYLKFREQLETEGVSDAFYNLWMPLLPVLQQMEARGIALDMDMVHNIREEYLEVADRNEKLIRSEGIRMIMERYPELSLDTVPKYYLRFATEDEIDNAYEARDGTLVTEVGGVAVPVLTKSSKAFKPRVIDFNTGSSPQLKELIYDHLGVQVPEGVHLKKSMNTGDVSLDKDNLNTLLFYNENPPETLKAILEWRKATKFIGTYLDRFISDHDAGDFNAIHTNFNQDGTDTGRLSSNSPNLQNIPSRGEVGKQARAMFIARPEHDLIVADLGQAELRLIAHYSQDQALLRAFEEGQDLHTLTGAAFARVSYDELYERYNNGEQWAKDMRMLGKTGNFALQYGMGATKFQRYLLVNNKYEISVEQAQEWIDGYNKMYEGATAWKEKVVSYARRNGHILTIKRRKRRLPGITSNQRGIRARAERQAINATVQGSVGDIISDAMIHIQPAITSFGGSLLLQVHDEIIAETPEQHSQVCAKLIETLMVSSANQYLRCPFVAEANIGKNWGIK